MGLDGKEALVVYAALHLSVSSLWPLWALLPAAIALAIFAYRRTTPPLAAGPRVLLTVLRATAYALLCLVLASPVWNRSRHDPQRARIAVVVDESASMSNVDAEGGPSRADAARTALAGLRDALRGAPVDLEVVPFAAVAGGGRTADEYLAAPPAATGPATDVLGALTQSADRARGQNLQALVLLSDGRPTQGALDPAGWNSAVPVFTVGFGDSLSGRDLAIGRCDYAPVAYVESQAEVEVRVENSGCRGQSTLLRLRQGDRDIFSQRIAFDQDRGRASLRIPLEFRTAGRQRYKLLLDPLPGERTERNNAREISIEVLQNRIRVLLVAARPDWDTAFWARALADDPNVRATVVTRDAQGGWRTGAGAAFQWPQGAGWIKDYDVYVLGSTAGGPGPQVWREVATAVERGRGLAILGGRDGVLADPAAFDALARVLPVSRGRARAPQFGQALPRLAPQGRHHPVTAALLPLADAAGGLPSLPPLLGQFPDVAPKPGAFILLATEGSPAAPLVIAARAGEGSAVVLNGFPLWRWGMAENEAVRGAAAGFAAGTVRWLVQPRDLVPVTLLTPKPVYESGESVDLRAHVLDAQMAPQTGASVHVDVHRVDDPTPVANAVLEPRSGDAGEYAAALPGLGPGEYEAEATASVQGREVGRARTRFTVDAYSTEFADVRQDVDFLREIAARSGGRYGGPGDIAAIAEALPRAARDVIVRSEIEVWNTAPLFVLFVLVLGAEWLLRKRYGLL